MKLNINSGILLDALKILIKAVPTKYDLMAYSYIHIDLQGTRLVLTTTNGHLTYRKELTAEEDSSDGQCCLDCRLLLNLLSQIPMLPLCIETKDQSVTISWFGGESEMPHFPVEDFPNIQVLKEAEIWLEFNSAALRSALIKTIPFMAKDPIRPMLNGVYFDMSNQGITLVSTNTRAMMTVVTNTDPVPGVEKAVGFVIDSKTCVMLRDSLIDENQTINLGISGNYVQINIGDTLILSRTVEGKFPNWRSVIPKTIKSNISVDKKAILGSLKRMNVFTDPVNNHIKINIDKDIINLQAQDLGFGVSGSESVPCKYDGEPIEIGFKNEFLIDTIKAIEAESVIIGINDPKMAVSLKAETEDPKESAILMPIIRQ